ncbi:accessory Sec system protein Asp3 [Streptococcus parauberis]|uniref:Accessory Sec system protein Asp3 n=1 Tax=Streptococcus parauberis TaxID=1348 RepID=A0A854WQ93_9STRE|nr:accessory Sec system protein Asp3 [Streptococcus parauberis]MDT2732329.1 accessory Sec system protein Asp3 [Streptococcus parauberis]PCH14208.1 Accessory Sec system protein Asp3 [Streptococcus parauberis]RFE02786.1 Accessory Sec system protein Asp3 [Streptococcus parauberis]
MMPLSIQGHIIPWGQLQSSSYLYGVDIVRLAGNRISYKQDYLPVGTIIHSWNSITTYQGDRDVPRLPRLKQKQDYTLSLQIESETGNAPYLRVSFFNRRKELLDQQIIKGISGQFTYPTGAYSYKIELINVSCQEFIFNNLILLEDKDEVATELPFYSQLMTKDKAGSSELSILFLEIDQGIALNLSDDFLEQFPSILVVANLTTDPEGYFKNDFVDYVKSKVDSLVANHSEQEIKWIGYGDKSNRAAIFFHDYYQKGQLLISDRTNFNENSYLNDNKDLSLYKKFLEKSDKLESIKAYQTKRDSDLPEFLSHLTDKSHALEILIKHEE